MRKLFTVILGPSAFQQPPGRGKIEFGLFNEYSMMFASQPRLSPGLTLRRCRCLRVWPNRSFSLIWNLSQRSLLPRYRLTEAKATWKRCTRLPTGKKENNSSKEIRQQEGYKSFMIWARLSISHTLYRQKTKTSFSFPPSAFWRRYVYRKNHEKREVCRWFGERIMEAPKEGEKASEKVFHKRMRMLNPSTHQPLSC